MGFWTPFACELMAAPHVFPDTPTSGSQLAPPRTAASRALRTSLCAQSRQIKQEARLVTHPHARRVSSKLGRGRDPPLAPHLAGQAVVLQQSLCAAHRRHVCGDADVAREARAPRVEDPAAVDQDHLGRGGAALGPCGPLADKTHHETQQRLALLCCAPAAPPPGPRSCTGGGEPAAARPPCSPAGQVRTPRWRSGVRSPPRRFASRGGTAPRAPPPPPAGSSGLAGGRSSRPSRRRGGGARSVCGGALRRRPPRRRRLRCRREGRRPPRPGRGESTRSHPPRRRGVVSPAGSPPASPRG